MGKDRVKKPRIQRINWKFDRMSDAVLSIVMPLADFKDLEQTYYERGWEGRRLHDERKAVEKARLDAVNGN